MTSGESQGGVAEALVDDRVDAPIDDGPSHGFLGVYKHQVDAKGRVAVPAQLRRHLPRHAVVAATADDTLMIWTTTAWARQLDLLRRTAETLEQEAALTDPLTTSAEPCEVDAQGRLLLSSRMRNWARIADSVVFLGKTDRIELCAPAAWQARGPEIDRDALRRSQQIAYQQAKAERNRS